MTKHDKKTPFLLIMALRGAGPKVPPAAIASGKGFPRRPYRYARAGREEGGVVDVAADFLGQLSRGVPEKSISAAGSWLARYI